MIIFLVRDEIGYGDLENDPWAHGMTVLGTYRTPELGDSSINTWTLVGLSVLMLAGVVVAHQKAKRYAR